MDPDNPVVKLCAAGMAAEGEGRSADAKVLFEQAFAESRDDYEACIAAHYVARHQPTAEQELTWNRLALERAQRVDDGRVRGFHASLYLNLAHSLEKLGQTAEACRHYSLAAERLGDVAAGPYERVVRTGITAGQSRTCALADGRRATAVR